MKKFLYLLIILLFLLCFINNENVLAFENVNISITPRIIGGWDAEITDFPYLGSLRRNNRHFCVAFCIRLHEFLSAAHCFTLMPNVIWPYMDVSLHTSTTTSYETGRTHRIIKVRVHPGWVGYGNKIHDIAHIKVANNYQFDPYLRPLDLPTEKTGSNFLAWVAGWGVYVQNQLIASPNLKSLQLWTLIYTECNPFLPDHLQIEKEQMCAYQQRGYGCADGDSGTPLVRNNVAVGLFAWYVSHHCADGEPEVYVNIYEENDFIELARQSD